MSFLHRDSVATTASSASSKNGMAMNWVLDHVLTYPTTYDFALPLRTIYTLNSATPNTSPADFKMLLMEHISKLPAQPCTLPPVFLSTFVKKCFPTDLENVGFDQALTALDYIRDLDIRRKTELERVAKLRGEHNIKIMGMRSRAEKVDQFYARAIVGIRRWTLIHELGVTPFNKFNCIAILNTLYPIEESDINPFLTAPILASQRHALWRYITGVEKNGPSILESAIGTGGGWSAVSDSIHVYLRLSLDMIEKCEDLARPGSIGSFKSDTSEESEVTMVNGVVQRGWGRRGRRQSDKSDDSSDEEANNGKTSTLERIVRGLARIGAGPISPKSRKVYSSTPRQSEEQFKMRYE